jgi:hypothetical protein
MEGRNGVEGRKAGRKVKEGRKWMEGKNGVEGKKEGRQEVEGKKGS